MGQAQVIEFLKNYKKSKEFRKKQWLSTKEIFQKLQKTKNASQLGSITNSVKKLRECNMIKSKEMTLANSHNSRKIYHYMA
jgi:predicted transcriptional regulator